MTGAVAGDFALDPDTLPDYSPSSVSYPSRAWPEGRVAGGAPRDLGRFWNNTIRSALSRPCDANRSRTRLWWADSPGTHAVGSAHSHPWGHARLQV